MPAKAHKPDDATRGKVEAYVACGTTEAEIAGILKIGLTTLKKHYARELQLGQALANAKVARGLFDLATNEKHGPSARVQASVAWLKMRAGWRDKSDEAPRVNVTGTNVTVDASVKVLQANVRALDDATLTTLNEALARLLPSAETKP